MTKEERNQILFWCAVIVLLLLAFLAGKKIIVNQESPDIVGAQLLPLNIPQLYAPDFGGSSGRCKAKSSCVCAGPQTGLPQYPDLIFRTVTLTPPTIYYQVPTPDEYVAPVLAPPDTPPPLEPYKPPVLPPMPELAKFLIPHRIEVYKDANYGSKKLVFSGPVADMNKTGLGLNDGISSIKATGKWEVFEHANYTGRSMVVEGDIANLAGNYLQDRISSMRPI